MAAGVSLREYFERLVADLSARLDERWASDRRAIDKAEQLAERALTTARDEARERLATHNGLIDKLEQQGSAHELARSADAATFATKDTLTATETRLLERIDRLERFQAKLVGGLVLASAIGLANFVRVWLPHG